MHDGGEILGPDPLEEYERDALRRDDDAIVGGVTDEMVGDAMAAVPDDELVQRCTEAAKVMALGAAVPIRELARRYMALRLMQHAAPTDEQLAAMSDHDLVELLVSPRPGAADVRAWRELGKRYADVAARALRALEAAFPEARL